MLFQQLEWKLLNSLKKLLNYLKYFLKTTHYLNSLI